MGTTPPRYDSYTTSLGGEGIGKFSYDRPEGTLVLGVGAGQRLHERFDDLILNLLEAFLGHLHFGDLLL